MSLCAVEGCRRPSRARGYCPTHLKRAQRHGDPLHVTIPSPAANAAEGPREWLRYGAEGFWSENLDEADHLALVGLR